MDEFFSNISENFSFRCINLTALADDSQEHGDLKKIKLKRTNPIPVSKIVKRPAVFQQYQLLMEICSKDTYQNKQSTGLCRSKNF